MTESSPSGVGECDDKFLLDDPADFRSLFLLSYHSTLIVTIRCDRCGRRMSGQVNAAQWDERAKEYSRKYFRQFGDCCGGNVEMLVRK